MSYSAAKVKNIFYPHDNKSVNYVRQSSPSLNMSQIEGSAAEYKRKIKDEIAAMKLLLEEKYYNFRV